MAARTHAAAAPAFVTRHRHERRHAHKTRALSWKQHSSHCLPHDARAVHVSSQHVSQQQLGKAQVLSSCVSPVGTLGEAGTEPALGGADAQGQGEG